MRRRRHEWVCGEQRELWKRWHQGQRVSEIARALSRPGSSVFNHVKAAGGFAPAERQRAEQALTLAEREAISRALAAGESLRSVARTLSRAPSTISREVRRHGGRGGYRACEADAQAWDRALRPKPCRLARQPRLCHAVARKLALQWSPQQISAWLERRYAGDETMRVSHETIYRSLFLQARGVLKKELLAHLRTQRSMRYPKTTKPGTHPRILNGLSIRERPAEANDRAIPGHWEGDLLCGGQHSQIATLVERHSRFVMLVKLANKDSDQLVKKLSEHVLKLPATLRRSITWDRGTEMAAHQNFTVATDVAVYFCDPHSPWQRGSNENTNGLLRQYFPKGTDLNQFSQRHLDQVAKRLNQRPRQTLGWDTPADTLQRAVAATG